MILRTGLKKVRVNLTGDNLLDDYIEDELDKLSEKYNISRKDIIAEYIINVSKKTSLHRTKRWCMNRALQNGNKVKKEGDST